MSTKDLLVLIIPVICNGILLFAIKSLIENRQRNVTKARVLKHQWARALLDSILVILDAYNIKDERLLITTVNDKMEEFVSFVNTNGSRIQPYSDSVQSVLRTWDKTVDILKDVQINDGGIVMGSKAEQVNTLIAQLHEFLISTAQKCVQQLS